MNKALIGVIAAGIAALIGLTVAAYWYASPRRTTTVLTAPIRTIPIVVGQASLPRVSFTPLEAPRPLPQIEFVDASGSGLTLADFRGRIVLLNIWATWCVPCRREMPALDRLQGNLGSPDFEVVALSIDRKGLPVVRKFFDGLGLEALNVYIDESGKAARGLGVFGIPTTLLVDRNGKEIGRVVGAAEWDSQETEVLIRRYLERKSGARMPSPGGMPAAARVGAEEAIPRNEASRP